MCIAIAVAVIAMGYGVLTYVGITLGPKRNTTRIILADQFSVDPAWHLAGSLPERSLRGYAR